MSEVKPEEKKKFYFLAAGYVFFHPQGKPEGVDSAFLNGVFANETGLITATDMGNAQRVLMQGLQNRAQGTVEIVDIQFTGFTHLGHMLPSEFHNIPAPAPVADPEPEAPAGE